MAQCCYAAAKNKLPILEILRPLIDLRIGNSERVIKVMEIASGTGEHANLFAGSIPGLHYQPTEPQLEMHESIRAWSASVTQSNVNDPIAVDVNELEINSILPLDFGKQQVDVMIH